MVYITGLLLCCGGVPKVLLEPHDILHYPCLLASRPAMQLAIALICFSYDFHVTLEIYGDCAHASLGNVVEAQDQVSF